MYGIEPDTNLLFFGDLRLEPCSLETNLVGFCRNCGAELWSLAYYRSEAGWQVAARCRECGDMILMRYDLSWNWLGDSELALAEPKPSGAADIFSLPREQLEAIFTPAELRDMEACARGESYVRQNLYRARAKYEKFEKLFGVRIEL